MSECPPTGEGKIPAEFHGRSVLVTGALGGIGAATVDEFADAGARVVGVDLGRVPDQHRPEVEHAICDVSDEADVQRLFTRLYPPGANLDVLVSNAGANVATPRRLVDVDVRDWDRIHGVNLRGAFLVLREGIRVMLRERRGGAVVLVSSLGAFRTGSGLAPYVTSKAGLTMLTRAAAVEYAEHGIRVNSVCPGSVDTSMLGVLGADGVANSRAKIPLGRLGHPSDIARLIRFVASDRASFITGEQFVADGGRSAS